MGRTRSTSGLDRRADGGAEQRNIGWIGLGPPPTLPGAAHRLQGSLSLGRREVGPLCGGAVARARACGVDGLELVVALAFELEEAEAVAEGIVQEREAAVWLLTRSCLDNGAGSPRSSNSCVEISDDEVQVEWRPMSSVGAKLRRPFEGLGTRHFQQQIDWSLRPQQLDKSGVETPTDAELERLRVERDGAFHVIDIQID